MTVVSKLKIKLFADSANQNEIIKYYHDPIIQGFTTNPTLMRHSGVIDYKSFALNILQTVQDKPIAFEVFADDLNEMEEQAYQIASWGKNVMVKIPVMNTQGQFVGELIKKLSRDSIVLNITAVFTIEQVQAILGCLSKETPAIISVFAGRIADTGIDPMTVMQQALILLKDYPKVELLWASPRELLNIVQANQIGCHIITLTDALLSKLHLLEKELHDYSLETVKMLRKDAISSGYALTPFVTRRLNQKLVSIILASNHSQSLKGFLNSIQETIENPKSVEVLIKIDFGDTTMRTFLEEAIKLYSFEIKYLETPKLDGYFSLHFGYQQLFNISDKNSYFIQILNDKVRFKTKDWDALLAGYVNFFPDGIFRLKLSQQKFCNYYSFHDCALIPDRFSLLTRKWIEHAGGIGHCWDTDIWHQFIEYHLGQIEGINGIPGIFRSVPVNDIVLDVENAERALDPEQAKERANRALGEMWRLYSPEAQQEFRLIATRMLVYIWTKNEDLNDVIIKDDSYQRELKIIDSATKQMRRGFYYHLSPSHVRIQNFYFLIKMARLKSIAIQETFLIPSYHQQGKRQWMNQFIKRRMLRLANWLGPILSRSESIPQTRNSKKLYSTEIK